MGYDFTKEIIKTNDGNYVFTGYSWGAYDIGAGLICKITPNGEEVWRNNIRLSSVLSIKNRNSKKRETKETWSKESLGNQRTHAVLVI